MKGHGTIHIGHDARRGGSYLRSGAAEPPFSIRECDGRVLIAASAAAPLGGDELSLDVDVGPHARGRVGTVASTVVLPGPTGAPSTMTSRCSVGPGAHLDWMGEPTVSVAGSDHTVTTVVHLDDTATCRIVEEVSLGRSGEVSGALRLVLRVERGGRAVLHHDESFGPGVPGFASSVSVGTARHVLSAVIVGVEFDGGENDDDGNDDGRSSVGVERDARVAWCPLTDDAAAVFAVGDDRPAVIRAVGRLAPRVLCPTDRRRR